MLGPLACSSRSARPPLCKPNLTLRRKNKTHLAYPRGNTRPLTCSSRSARPPLCKPNLTHTRKMNNLSLYKNLFRFSKIFDWSIFYDIFRFLWPFVSIGLLSFRPFVIRLFVILGLLFIRPFLLWNLLIGLLLLGLFNLTPSLRRMNDVLEKFAK